MPEDAVSIGAFPLGAADPGTRANFASERRPWKFGRRGIVALVGGSALLVGLVAASVILLLRSSQDLKRVTRTQQVNMAVVAVRNDLNSAESGQRGYLLTGKKAYLGPYQQAADTLEPRLQRLEELTRGDPALAPLVRTIRAVAEDKLAELAQTIRLDSAGNRIAAMALVDSDQGQTAMERLRGLIETVSKLERDSLVSGLGGMRADTRLLTIADGTGLVILAVLAAIVTLGAVRGAQEIERARHALWVANEELGRINETLEEKVAARTADLTAANDEIQRFAYIVSHDLRAPLVNIMGFTSELEIAGATIGRHLAVLDDSASDELREAVTESLPEAIGFIRASTGKMDRLIRAILQLAREGRRVLTAEPVAMADLARGIVGTLAHQLDDASAEIQIGDMPDVVSDRVAVEQIFSNLIENAVKYVKPGRPGRIAVSGRAIGKEAIFEIRDNGRGIDPRDLERVFELFRRAGDQTVPGEGIGLAHVRALVRRLDGTINCESVLDVGSTFRVKLPLVLAPVGVQK